MNFLAFGYLARTLILLKHAGRLRIRRTFLTTKREITSDTNFRTPATMAKKFEYPKAERDESIVEEFFETKVADPYRWLEDPDSEQTKTFVDDQNAVTQPYLEQCPHRASIKKILTQNQDYVKFGCPFKRGGKYYFFKNSGLEPQAVLFQQDTLESEPEVFFNPNLLSEDGTVALSTSAFSHDGKYFAYGLSYGGSDWVEIRVKEVESKEDIEDRLTRAKFTSIEWTHDNNGFFYAMFPSYEGDSRGKTDSIENHSIFYHRLNTSQKEDVLKVDYLEKPKWHLYFQLSQDGRYLHVVVNEGCRNHLWFYCDLTKSGEKEKLSLQPIYDKMEARFEYVHNEGETVYFKTNLDADNFRIAKLNISNPAKETWVDVIPNHPTDVLNWAEIYKAGGKDLILLNYTRKVASKLELRNLDGSIVKEFDFPPGTISKKSGLYDDGEVFFSFSSFLNPGQSYRHNLLEPTGEPSMIMESNPSNFEPNNFKIEQVFYRSKDGTEVPMFIVAHKDLKKDGTNPCVLYGYGGFSIQVPSAFSINRVMWYKNFKGILAVANIRGGGEFGQKWHDSGRLLNKQNCFDDFISAAEYLISNKWTNRNKLAVQGGSNGGLLVAATSNQRPDLFRASICHVGVLDMIRYNKFTIGHAWATEFGDPKEKVHFDNLIKYSPYHNIPKSVDVYPATLLLTADHDDRVVPAHSLKFIAQLQNTLGEKLPDTPFLVKVDTKAGHGAGKPTSKVIDEYTDIYCFLYNVLDLEGSYIDE